VAVLAIDELLFAPWHPLLVVRLGVSQVLVTMALLLEVPIMLLLWLPFSTLYRLLRVSLSVSIEFPSLLIFLLIPELISEVLLCFKVKLLFSLLSIRLVHFMVFFVRLVRSELWFWWSPWSWP